MFKLYDEKGKMFEIQRADKVTELMNNFGWTPWHPDHPPVIKPDSKNEESRDK